MKSLRKWNLLTLTLTGLSWTVLGIWYGFGYCPFTDWHFDILRELGRTDLPSSYIVYLLNRLLGLSLSTTLVDTMTGVLFAGALFISAFLNYRDWKRA